MRLLLLIAALGAISCDEKRPCGGAYACPCPAGLSTCKFGPSAYGCYDLSTDNDNCGTCHVGCGPGTCTAGVCVCAPGATYCPVELDPGLESLTPLAYACRNISTDSDSCGACGVACGLGTCVAGACICDGPPVVYCAVTVPPGYANPHPYGYACVNPQNNRLNCGACGVVCTLLQSCVAGVCQ
jgi:hypothetical protein